MLRPGYTISAFETQSCDYRGRHVIGRIRPIFKGVEKYGMHQIAIPGDWEGQLCDNEIFHDQSRFVSPHNSLYWVVPVASYSTNCSNVAHGGSNEFVLAGMLGTSTEYVESLAAHCKEVLPPTVPSTPPRPTFVSTQWGTPNDIWIAGEIEGRFGSMWAPDNAFLVGFAPIIQLTTPHFNNIYPVDALALGGALTPARGQPIIDFVWGAPKYGADPMSPTYNGPGWDPSPVIDTKACDSNYVLTGLFGIKRPDRIRNINGRCQAMDLENAARTGSALVSLYAEAEDFFTYGIHFGGGGGPPSDENSFSAQCPEGQQMRGFMFEAFDHGYANAVDDIRCNTMAVTTK